ncbi:MAG: PhzF family phenazine biosynthesis isomerase [Alphaproteobacteria bacterium]|nr:PhzF family phenazine biosynthesis isomerase [Alphaproteobacteria bacterium]
MRIHQYQIDAFTDHLFGGNPAAVCLLESWLPVETMQAIATENNLSETVFCVPERGGYGIRWFTPRLEIGLAGHPTLAAAWVILNDITPDVAEVRFTSYGGDVLSVVRDGKWLIMDFPAVPATKADNLPEIAEALGAVPDHVLAARDMMAVFQDEATVHALDPDMTKVAALDTFGLIATAPGEDCDFVSRFFAPQAGIPEDPVTGSAHCTLAPYWAERLGKTQLFARQISERGGEIHCEHLGDRVRLGGTAVPFMEGYITL